MSLVGEAIHLAVVAVHVLCRFMVRSPECWKGMKRMNELTQKVNASIERLKIFAPKNGEGYYLAFSGGKDSVVCKALLEMAGVKYDAHYRVTSVDPPELVQFIKEKHQDVEREKPMWDAEHRDPRLRGKPITMWNLIPHKKFPPTRIVRYCCASLKESGGDGRKAVTGVRWAEGTNRKINHGAVTIMDRNAGRILADNENFRRTDRGGGADKRQRGKQEDRRDVLPAHEDRGQSYYRLDRRRCLGIHQSGKYPLLRSV